MAQSMGKVGCGGTCGDNEPCNSLDQISSSSRTLEASSSLMSSSKTHPFGIFILFTAGNFPITPFLIYIYIFHI